MPIGCVLFLFYYLCSEFLEIILKEMRGLAIIFRFFMLLVLLLGQRIFLVGKLSFKRIA